MTNSLRQKQLDKNKWCESEKQNFDMSGFMTYCNYCNSRGGMHGECTATQEKRENQCLCAKAYNRMYKNK